jgi:hypothetical protein
MGPGYFNRYAYTLNDPVNATDPTGVYARGERFTDEQWEAFDAVQQQAAADMTLAADSLLATADALEAEGSLEEAGGLRVEAEALQAGAEVLAGDQYAAHNEARPLSAPAAVDRETRDLSVDMNHRVWSASTELQPEFMLGHEALHSSGILVHASFTIRPGVRADAYRFGDHNEREAFRSIPLGSPLARRNPDHLMTRVYP